MQENQSEPASDANWEFHSDDGSSSQSQAPAELPQPEAAPVAWTASEYVAHHKDPSWYFIAGGATLVIAIIAFFLTGRSWFSMIAIGIGGGVFIASAARPPRVLDYLLDNKGLTIGNKPYGYSMYKSFCVVDEGPIRAVLLMPMERFTPSLTVYFDPTDEQKITEVLGMHLPYEDHPPGVVDNLMRKIRF